MDARLERAITVFRAVIHELRVEKVTFLAGSIAYHAVVSLLPLLLLSLGVLSTVGDEALQRSFTELVEAAFTPEVATLLVERLDEASPSLSILGLVVLLWGTLRIFRGLDQAFSDIYETESENDLADQFTDGLVVLLTFGLAVAAGWTTNAALAALGSGPVLRVLQWIVLVAGLSVVLLPMYYVFPDADVTLREVVPGTVLAAVGLAAFESVFHLYAAFKAPGGVVAGLLVLLTWLYVSALVILVGAAVNAVLSNRSRTVDIEPVVGGARSGGVESASGTEERLATRLRRIETEAADAEEVVVGVGGTEVRLPPPRRVTVEDETVHTGEGGTARLDLQWGHET